ncbi:MAG: flagellin [Rhodospirillaceae bacterium]|jgi:flagellin-like hook-associated protein FlgL
MADEVVLTSAVRGNLLALQNTTGLIDRTQGRLATGLSVESAIDDPLKFFQAKSLLNRANDLTSRKDGIGQGISTLETVVEATEAIETLVQQIKGTVDAARSQTKAQREEAQIQVQELVTQIQKLVEDATFQGLNLLNSTASKLTVRFSDKDDSKLEVDGVDFNASQFYLNSAGTSSLSFNATAGASITVSRLGFIDQLSTYSLSLASILASFNEQANLAITRLDQTIENVRAKSATIATNVSILQVRLDFTDNYVNILTEGADKLRLADLNEEGANLLALQTRQALGIQSLAFAGQAEQAILGLFQ